MKQAKAKKRIAPVVDTMAADLLTPLGVYLKLAESGTHSFLLESVEGGEALARYSFVGVNPEFVVRGEGRSVTVERQGSVEKIEISTLQFLRRELDAYAIDSDEDLPSFVGGAIGYLGFDCCGWFEPKLESATGESAFMFFRTVVAFDHAKQIVRLISLPDDDGGIDAAKKQNENLRRILEDTAIQIPKSGRTKSLALITSNWSQPDFENAVAEIKELIASGECYQVVLSQCFLRETAAHPISIYRALRSINPSPYMFLLQIDKRSIIGASPEMQVKSTGSNLEYRPIAGTRPRGKRADEDAALAEEMRIDKKEVAEHVMLVDLGRNDLGRVAEYGSVKVDQLMTVEKYSHVQHLVSRLSATLRSDLDRFDALAACFPAGTVSGAPKVRAIEIIREMEPTSRGAYAGSVGYFDYSGNMDTCIAIRTLVLEDGVATIQAGAGIVADSVPKLEYEETVNKARGLLRAIEIAEGQD